MNSLGLFDSYLFSIFNCMIDYTYEYYTGSDPYGIDVSEWHALVPDSSLTDFYIMSAGGTTHGLIKTLEIPTTKAGEVSISV